jgi:hypothetical protein
MEYCFVCPLVSSIGAFGRMGPVLATEHGEVDPSNAKISDGY